MTTQTHTINLINKDDCQTVRFVQAATSTDQARDALRGIHVTKEKITAADGFVLHQAPTPYSLQMFLSNQGKDEMILKPDGVIRKNPKAQIWEEIDAKFPDAEQIITGATKEKPIFRIALNTELLKKLDEIPGNTVILDFSGPGEPVVARPLDVESYPDTLGMIMPMNLKDNHPLGGSNMPIIPRDGDNEGLEARIKELEQRIKELHEALDAKNKQVEELSKLLDESATHADPAAPIAADTWKCHACNETNVLLPDTPLLQCHNCAALTTAEEVSNG